MKYIHKWEQFVVMAMSSRIQGKLPRNTKNTKNMDKMLLHGNWVENEWTVLGIGTAEEKGHCRLISRLLFLGNRG